MITCGFRSTRRPRGFGFVTFSDEAAAQLAISEMNGKVIDGRPLTVNAATARGGSETDANDHSKFEKDNSWKTAPPSRASKQGRAGECGRGGRIESKQTTKSWTDWASPTASMNAAQKK